MMPLCPCRFEAGGCDLHCTRATPQSHSVPAAARCAGNRKTNSMKFLIAAALLGALPVSDAMCASLEAPKGAVVLTITGDIQNTNAANSATFDLPMLQALAGRQAVMDTPWTNGATEFEGPYLKAVLDAAGAHGKTLRVKALNDYSADVPMTDASDYETILALKMNGRPMSVRDKGPLFMIYPFDKNHELYNEKYFSRSVWQIKEIEVVD